MADSWNNPVIMQEAQALMALTNDLQKPFEQAVAILADCSGQVVCTGIGKSGHVATKVAMTLTSMECPGYFLHPTESSPEELDAISENDAILVFSRSGRAVELVDIVEKARSKGTPVILISENDQDSLAEYSSVVLKMPPIDENWGHAPTTSTIIQMAIGDALAVTLAQKKEFTEDAAIVALAQKQPFNQ